jgi:membrane associated rhomboid family serine protease
MTIDRIRERRGAPDLTGRGARLASSRDSAGLTIAIIALNVAVFGLMVMTGVSPLNPSADIVLKWGADYGPLTLNGQWWRPFTSLFLHFGLAHLLFNMVVLANIGRFMETLLGKAAYLILYIVSGLGSAVASLWSHPMVVSAGASGAIFGLYGGLLAFLLRHRNSISPAALNSLSGGALLFVGYNVVYGLFQPTVDLAAHLGGLVTGFLLGLLLVQPFSQEAGAADGRRNAIATLLGLVLLGVTVIALPKPSDLSAEVKRMSEMEEKALALYNSSVENWNTNQLTDPQFLGVVEHQILPPWRAERESLQKLEGLSKEQTVLTSSLVRYMRAREEAWDLLADGVRTGDTDQIRRSREKSHEADKLAEQVGTAEKK